MNQSSVERRGAIAIVRFSNPPEGCIATQGAAQLADDIETLLSDPAVRGIVLTGGQDGVFIRHADVAQLVRAAEAISSGRTQPADFVDSPFARLTCLLDAADKPVIAAINGICMGGGLEIALACTMRVASPAVTEIGLPEIRIGIFPGGGGTQRLPRVMGWHRARLFMLKGAVVDATEAHALGIVDELAPSPLDRAIGLAQEFAKRPGGAVAAILRLTQGSDSRENLAAEAISFAELLRDDSSAVARMRKFVEERQKLDEVD